MIEWFRGLPEWLQAVIAFWMLCAAYFAYLCFTAPSEKEVYGRSGYDI